ncbi:hypothetical protein M8C21_016932 [Ambrosia artemisiifolia]|uniref:Uncharacterized protein n=1 Tax=Ambrosia artemisiifolia TaxID=4212 RepID=A0AAD5G660_AMBAR|nr:hypothetical protein M8C21_016932 [Ambrosia artemisiifolia]
MKEKLVLEILARKPDAFSKTNTSITKIKRSISSALSFIGLKVRALEKESSALTLLRFVWDGILEKPNIIIDSILRGPGVLIEQDNETVSEWAIQVVKLQKLISEHVAKMKDETNNIITRSSDSTNHNTKHASVEEEQVMELQNLIYERLVTVHDETHKIIKSPDSIKQDNRPVSSKIDPALKLKSLIFEHIADMHYKTQEVRNMIPPAFRERKNKDGLTSRELFTEEHKELIREGRNG